MKRTITEFEIKKIEVFIQALRSRTLLCNIVSVSQSGMNRKMSFLTIADGQVWRFNDLFKLDDCKLDKNGNVNVSGCGMDMVWNTVYNIAHRLNNLGYISKDELPTLAQASAVII